MKAIISGLAAVLLFGTAYVMTGPASAQERPTLQDDPQMQKGKEVTMTGEIVSLREHLFGKQKEDITALDDQEREDREGRGLEKVSTRSMGNEKYKGETLALVADGRIHVLLPAKSTDKAKEYGGIGRETGEETGRETGRAVGQTGKQVSADELAKRVNKKNVEIKGRHIEKQGISVILVESCSEGSNGR